MHSVDLAGAGLPSHLALRLSGHVGPIFPIRDPVTESPSFTGSHVNRTDCIEPVTPPGAVYVTGAFAADLELAGDGGSVATMSATSRQRRTTGGSGCTGFGVGPPHRMGPHRMGPHRMGPYRMAAGSDRRAVSIVGDIREL